MKLQINIQQYRVTSNFLFLVFVFVHLTRGGVLLLPFVLFYKFTIPNVYVYVMYVLMYCVVRSTNVKYQCASPSQSCQMSCLFYL
jgi:hypothetical protein